VLDNKFVGFISSCVLNTEIWIRHDQLLVSESLKFFLVLQNSSCSSFQDFQGSKRLSFVNLKRELLSIDFISGLLLVSHTLLVVIFLSNLSLSSSLKILLIVKSFLESFHFLFLFLFI
jgi:hypothetical protein